jgi:hypothetical protein
MLMASLNKGCPHGAYFAGYRVLADPVIEELMQPESAA